MHGHLVAIDNELYLKTKTCTVKCYSNRIYKNIKISKFQYKSFLEIIDATQFDPTETEFDSTRTVIPVDVGSTISSRLSSKSMIYKNAFFAKANIGAKSILIYFKSSDLVELLEIYTKLDAESIYQFSGLRKTKFKSNDIVHFGYICADVKKVDILSENEMDFDGFLYDFPTGISYRGQITAEGVLDNEFKFYLFGYTFHGMQSLRIGALIQIDYAYLVEDSLVCGYNTSISIVEFAPDSEIVCASSLMSLEDLRLTTSSNMQENAIDGFNFYDYLNFTRTKDVLIHLCIKMGTNQNLDDICTSILSEFGYFYHKRVFVVEVLDKMDCQFFSKRYDFPKIYTISDLHLAIGDDKVVELNDHGVNIPGKILFGIIDVDKYGSIIIRDYKKHFILQTRSINVLSMIGSIIMLQKFELHMFLGCDRTHYITFDDYKVIMPPSKLTLPIEYEEIEIQVCIAHISFPSLSYTPDGLEILTTIVRTVYDKKDVFIQFEGDQNWIPRTIFVGNTYIIKAPKKKFNTKHKEWSLSFDSTASICINSSSEIIIDFLRIRDLWKYNGELINVCGKIKDLHCVKPLHKTIPSTCYRILIEDGDRIEILFRVWGWWPMKIGDNISLHKALVNTGDDVIVEAIACSYALISDSLTSTSLPPAVCTIKSVHICEIVKPGRDWVICYLISVESLVTTLFCDFCQCGDCECLKKVVRFRMELILSDGVASMTIVASNQKVIDFILGKPKICDALEWNKWDGGSKLLADICSKPKRRFNILLRFKECYNMSGSTVRVQDCQAKVYKCLNGEDRVGVHRRIRAIADDVREVNIRDISNLMDQ